MIVWYQWDGASGSGYGVDQTLPIQKLRTINRGRARVSELSLLPLPDSRTFCFLLNPTPTHANKTTLTKLPVPNSPPHSPHFGHSSPIIHQPAHTRGKDKGRGKRNESFSKSIAPLYFLRSNLYKFYSLSSLFPSAVSKFPLMS